MAFVKSGWLLRQSTILKRWKKNWFDLWSDGHLIYYDDQTRQVLRIRFTCQWTASTSAWGMSVGIFSLQMGSQKTVCCRLFAEMGKLSVFVQKAQMIVWPGNLHSRIPGRTQRHMAMVHTVVHTLQELKLSMLQMDRLMLYPTSTHMQDFMDNSLPTKSSFGSGIETATVIWPWACWPEQPPAWP
uniref:PH domain-containing protein n=1 Tax=Suricata suricatta TaxID=37032 RepID=A0A673T7T0_SURSU